MEYRNRFIDVLKGRAANSLRIDAARYPQTVSYNKTGVVQQDTNADEETGGIALGNVQH